MIDGKCVLGVIAARGGSKGLPRKNVLPVGGKPMIAWSVDAARGSALLDRAVVSTDDREIAAAASQYGADVPFLRPAELATDAASIYDVLFHALDAVEGVWNYVVLLQATSPLRRAEDIDACVRMCVESGAPAVISVSVPAKSPYWMLSLSVDGRMHPLFDLPADRQRQDLPPAYVPNGSVYVAETAWLRANRSFLGADTRAYVMAPEWSVDVDYPLDLLVADALLRQNERT